MKKLLVIAGALVALVVVVVVAGLGWATMKTSARLSQKIAVTPAEIPIPWPLNDEDLAALRAERQAATDAPPAGEAERDPLEGVDLQAIARERGAARGKRLIDTRLGCTDCHKADFGGGVVVENGAMGRWAAPNITAAGVAKDYTAQSWVGILRHGLRRDGKPALMPAIDYAMLSDQELSDVATYVTSMPPVERESLTSEPGPIFKMLIATGEFPVSAEHIDHKAARPKTPPPAQVDVSYGKHVAQVCVGCHGLGFSGGKIPGGDPDWPAAANLTPDESGLKAWSEADFVRSLREGKRPDGSEVNTAMPWKAIGGMNDVELKAMYAFFMSLPPTPAGSR